MRCLGGVAILLYLGCSPPVSSSGAGNSSCRNGAVSCRGATMVLHCVDNQWEEQGACEQGLFCIDGECSDDGCPDGVRPNGVLHQHPAELFLAIESRKLRLLAATLG